MHKLSPPVTPSREETRQKKCQRFLQSMSPGEREAHLRHTAMLYEINKATKLSGSTEPKPNQHSFSLSDGTTIEFSSPPRGTVGIISTGAIKSPGERVGSSANRATSEPMDQETEAILEMLATFSVSKPPGGAPTTAPSSPAACVTPPRLPRKKAVLPQSPDVATPVSTTSTAAGSPAADSSTPGDDWF